jgi:excisionase family DNA binding protein
MRIVDPETHPRRSVSLAVAADYLGIDRRTLNKMIEERAITAERVFNRRRILVSELTRVSPQPLGRVS